MRLKISMSFSWMIKITIELDNETINLDVNGTQQTVNVTSNDSWTWAQAAARTVLRMMGR